MLKLSLISLVSRKVETHLLFLNKLIDERIDTSTLLSQSRDTLGRMFLLLNPLTTQIMV